MIILIPAFILAFIGLRINVKRIKAPKLSSILSWIITLVFGIVLAGMFFDSGDIDTLLEGDFVSRDMIFLVVIEMIILLVLNILTAENKFKAVLLSICQIGASVALIAFIIILLIAIFFGGGSSLKKITGGLKSYTNEENQYAKANGYFDAQSANEKGFDTSQANNPGFDYTQKKD